MMKKFILALISMSLLLASGCAHIEEYDTEETADTEETTEVQTVTVDNPEYYTRFKNDVISINVYNWGEYIPDGSEEGELKRRIYKAYGHNGKLQYICYERGALRKVEGRRLDL